MNRIQIFMPRRIGRLFAMLVLGVAAARAEQPRVAVVFEEQVRGVFGMSGAWMDPGRGEEAVIEALRSAGYRVVDAQTVRANLLREQAVQVLAGDQKAAVAAGSRLQAPWVVIGKGYAKSAGQVVGSSMKSIQGSVQLSLVDAASGDVLAAVTGAAAKPHVDEVTGGGEALAAAATDAAAKLLDRMSRGLAPGAAAVPSVKVTISGLKSYRHYIFIKEWLEKNAAGARSVREETYTAGNADLVVETGLKGPELAKKIALAPFEGFAVNPIDVREQSVALKVILRE